MDLEKKLTYSLIRAVVYLFELLPLAWAVRFGRVLGSLFYRLDLRHRRITLGNLQRALGRECSDEELRDIAKRAYRNLGASVAEIMKVGVLSPERVTRWVDLEGLDHYEQAAAKGRGVLFVTAHFGNWELMPIAFSMRGHRLFGVARPLDNPYLDRLVRMRRERWGNQILSKYGALQEVRRLLAQGEAVGFLLDQNVSGRGGSLSPSSTSPHRPIRAWRCSPFGRALRFSRPSSCGRKSAIAWLLRRRWSWSAPRIWQPTCWRIRPG